MECPDWSVELRERHRLLVDILQLAKRLDVSFAFPTRTLHLFQEEQGAGESPAKLPVPLEAGQREAARIVGPPLSAGKRPGRVEFTGPTEVDPNGPDAPADS